jgi:hypothetical protein
MTTSFTERDEEAGATSTRYHYTRVAAIAGRTVRARAPAAPPSVPLPPMRDPNTGQPTIAGQPPQGATEKQRTT